MRIFRGLTILVTVAMAIFAGGVAQAAPAARPYSAEPFVERLLGWMEGLWQAVAASEAEVPPGEPDDAAPGERLGLEPSAELQDGELGNQTEGLPEYDPNGAT